MNRTQGLYIISVAAQLLEMHPQTLRKYERAGFIDPPRMGTLRLYSEEDIARLRLIKYFVEELGLNLAGVELALKLTGRLLSTRARLKGLRDPGAAREEAIAALDKMLESLGVQVDDDEGVEPSAAEAPRSGPRRARGETVRLLRLSVSPRRTTV